jgi:hypothetical protein
MNSEIPPQDENIHPEKNLPETSMIYAERIFFQDQSKKKRMCKMRVPCPTSLTLAGFHIQVERLASDH